MIAWRQNAACRNSDPRLFFPEPGQNATQAKQICATCPVHAQCLGEALSSTEPCYGVWGGLTEKERRKHARAARWIACQNPGCNQTIPAHPGSGQPRRTCSGACRMAVHRLDRQRTA